MNKLLALILLFICWTNSLHSLHTNNVATRPNIENNKRTSLRIADIQATINTHKSLIAHETIKRKQQSRNFIGIILLPYIICFFAEHGVWPDYPTSMQSTVAEMGQSILSQDDEHIRTYCRGKLKHFTALKSGIGIFKSIWTHQTTTEYYEPRTSRRPLPTITTGAPVTLAPVMTAGTTRGQPPQIILTTLKPTTADVPTDAITSISPEVSEPMVTTVRPITANTNPITPSTTTIKESTDPMTEKYIPVVTLTAGMETDYTDVIGMTTEYYTPTDGIKITDEAFTTEGIVNDVTFVVGMTDATVTRPEGVQNGSDEAALPDNDILIVKGNATHEMQTTSPTEEPVTSGGVDGKVDMPKDITNV